MLRGFEVKTLAIIKLASCSGCLNQVVRALASEEKLLNFYNIVLFDEITERLEMPKKIDLLLIEGSTVTREQEEVVKKFREISDFVVAMGTCAVQGGVQALRIGDDVEKVKAYVYPNPEHIDVNKDVKPVDNVISVDMFIPGCPVNHEAIASLLKKFVSEGLPIAIPESVCSECKRKGIVCVMVAYGIPCLGPITISGCGAICPSFGRGCYGCFGLKDFDLDNSKLKMFAQQLKDLGMDNDRFEQTVKAYSWKTWSKYQNVYHR